MNGIQGRTGVYKPPICYLDQLLAYGCLLPRPRDMPALTFEFQKDRNKGKADRTFGGVFEFSLTWEAVTCPFDVCPTDIIWEIFTCHSENSKADFDW